MPVILSVTVSPSTVISGQTVQLRAEAIDEDGDAITYAWASQAGVFDQVVGSSVGWTAPAFGGDYDLVVTASDRRASTSAVVRLVVRADQFAGNVTIQSTPSGAEIFLDGTTTFFLTPHTFTGLDVGDYVVSLRLTNRYMFPDTTLLTLQEDVDTTVTVPFVTTQNVGRTTGGVVASPPQLSPDGLFVVWSDDRSGTHELHWCGVTTSDTDFTTPALLNYDTDAYRPTFGVNGIQRIVFQTSVADTGSVIRDVLSNGGSVRPFLLTGDARQGRFAPSGSRFVYVSHERIGGTYRTHVKRLTNILATNTVTGTEEILHTYESTAGRVTVSTPVFSSDESRILYAVTQPGGTSDLHTIDLGAGVERTVGGSTGARWGAFGTAERIVFYETASGVFGAVFDTGTGSLGRPMRFGPVGAREPSFGRTSAGTSKHVAYATTEGVIVASGFTD